MQCGNLLTKKSDVLANSPLSLQMFKIQSPIPAFETLKKLNPVRYIPCSSFSFEGLIGLKT